MKLALQRPDDIGALASGLCMIHCLATPFIFIAQTCTATCCDAAPAWWKWIDYLFLVVSFFAVYQSAKTTSKNWMRIALWVSWGALFAVILSERLSLLHLPEFITYLVASSLIALHLYNRRYCNCKKDACCVNK